MTLTRSLAAALLLCSLGLIAYAQDPTGPRPKRPRTPEDYKPGTLKEFSEKANRAGVRGDSTESRSNKQETMVIEPDLSPTRVRATYAGATARIPTDKAELIRQWAMRYAGAPETYTKHYEVDVMFNEDGTDYWLTSSKKTLESFWKTDTKKPVDLFLIKMGAVKHGDKWVPVLLLENFQPN